MTRIQKFENEYKVDPFKLVEDVNLKYINLVKKTGLQSLIATYVEDNFSFEPTEDFYILLIECFLESKERFPQGQKFILDTPFIISNIPLNPSIPKDKGELESFKNIVAEDTLRPALTGVFVDEKGYLIGTDAFKLVQYQSNKYNKYANKIINLSTYLKSKGKLIEFIDEKYPNYEIVLPKKSSYILENQNLYAWYNYAKSVSAIKKYILNEVVNCQIKMPDNEIYTLSPIILAEVLEFFISKGYKKCAIEYENNRKAILFVFDGSKGLIMPMVSDELNGASPISLDEINTIFSEQGSILPRKKITTPKTQIEEEEPNIAYKKFEGKLSDTTYIPRRDISYVMLKNGDKLYSSDIIDGVYKLNTKMADGGMMENGRISAYPNDDYENILGNFDSLETAKKFAKLNKWKYETLTFEDSKGDTIVVSKEDSFKDIDFLFSLGMAEGGMMEDGGKINSWIGSYKKPIKTSDVRDFLNSTKNDGHKYSLWNKSVGVTFAYNGKLYANNGQVLPKGTIIDLDKVMNHWEKNNCDTLFVEDEKLVILPEKQDKYNCYTTGYDGRKNDYGNEDDLTLQEAVDFCWYFDDVRKKYKTEEDLKKEINSTPYGKNNIIASSGITGVVVYKLSTQQYANGGMMADEGEYGVDKHRVYFQTFGEVMSAIHDIAEDNGYEVVDIFPDLSYGGFSYGETRRASVELVWNGKEKRGKSKKREKNTLNVQIYRMDSGNYELNTYFSYASGGMMADGGIMAKGGENDIGYSIILKPIVVENSARFDFNINKRGDGNNIFGYVNVRKVNDVWSERDYYQFKNVEGFEWVYFMENSSEDYISDKRSEEQKNIEKEIKKLIEKEMSKNISEHKIAPSGMMADGGVIDGEWVVYNPNDYSLISTHNTHSSAKIAMKKLWHSGRYDELGIMTQKEWGEIMNPIDETESDGGMTAKGGMMAKGGGVGEPYDSMTKFQLEKELKKLNEKRDLLKRKYGSYPSDEITQNENEIDKIITLLYGKDFSGVGQKFKYSDGGMMANGGVTKKDEIVYIEYLNKDKKYTKDKKQFKGQHAYKDAIAWGIKNISNFNMDMVKYVMADGGQMEDDVDLFEEYENLPKNVQSILEKYAEVFEEGNYNGLKEAKSELEMIGYTFEYGLDGQAYNLKKLKK